MSYESIPDVEQGEALPSSEILIQRAQEKYPAAGTAVEAEFLGRLDDAIDNCKAEIKIPRLSSFQLEGDGKGESGYTELVKSLKLPTAALAVTLVSAAIVISTNNLLTRALFPYYACILTFASGIPSIATRFVDRIAPVFAKMASVKTGVEQKVEGISDKGLNYLGVTEKAMHSAIAPIKDKLAMATKLEAMLKKVDPTIDIPDPSDIERSFDSYEGELKGAFAGMQGLVDISRSLPAPLQSMEKFQMYVVVPFLAVMLILQLVGVYQTSNGVVSAEDDEEAAAQTVNETVRVFNETLRRFLLPELGDDDSIHDVTIAIDRNETAAAFGGAGGADAAEPPAEESEWLLLMWTAIQAYLTTALTIAIAFVVTQMRFIVTLTNAQIAKLESNVNKSLKEKVGDVFESVFQKGFGSVKEKFLTLVRKVDLIEQPLRIVQDQIPGGGMLGKFMM